MQETQEMQVNPWVQDPPEEEMATHSSILAWKKIPWTEKSGGLQSMGLQSDTTERLSTAHDSTVFDK